MRVEMIVCSCNVLSDGQIKACVAPGPGCPRTASDVYQCLGCSPKCGRCARTIRQIVANALMGVDVPVAITACASECAAACPIGKAHDHSAHDHTAGQDHARQDHARQDHAEPNAHRHEPHRHEPHRHEPARLEAMSGA